MVVVISSRLCEQHAELGRRMVEGEGCGLHVAAGIKERARGTCAEQRPSMYV